MCGICGIINFDQTPVCEPNIRRMMQKMKHRGPDDDGVYIQDNIGLGFVRLSILDLSPAGHQPMTDCTGRFTIVHNGEVYNYIEIREELVNKGYTFRSDTDTEVILNAVIEWGPACLDKFNGMWADVIFDQEEKSFFISRDRFGIKPFYYYRDDRRFIFASEIQPILSVLEGKPSPDNQVIFDYLVFNRTDQTEATFFSGIKKLQHGHAITIKDNEVHFKKWYDLRSNLNDPFRSSEAYYECLKSAVGLRLRSDVPVGVCLSGGLDSSAITSVLLKDFKKDDLNTFSAVYRQGQTGDESEFINLFKDNLENMHFITPGADSLMKDIDRFVIAHGEPIPSTAPYAQFKVMELAGRNVVVTLDGQGADEELAGYHYFYGFYYKDLFTGLHWITLLREMLYYSFIHRSAYGFETFLYFLLPARWRTRLRMQEKGYLTKDFASAYQAENAIAGNLYGSASLNDALLDHFEYKLEHLLKWEDRNSMAFSLESRVPFLDHRLAERTLALPNGQKINQGMTKSILRKAMKGVLPEQIRTRKDKIGFMTPQDEWFREPVFISYIQDLLQSDHFRGLGMIDVQKARSLYLEHLAGKINVSKEIWKWIHLDRWFSLMFK